MNSYKNTEIPSGRPIEIPLGIPIGIPSVFLYYLDSIFWISGIPNGNCSVGIDIETTVWRHITICKQPLQAKFETHSFTFETSF